MVEAAPNIASNESKAWGWVKSHWLNLLSLLLIPVFTVLAQQAVSYWQFKLANFEMALQINRDAEKYDAQAREWAFRQIAEYTKSVADPLDVLSPELRAKLCLKPREDLLRPIVVSDLNGVPDIKNMKDMNEGTFVPFTNQTMTEWFKAGGVWGFSSTQYEVVTQLNQLISEINAGCAAVQAKKTNQ